MRPRTPASLLAASLALVLGPAALADTALPGDARSAFLAVNPGTGLYQADGRVTTVYGPAFSFGDTAAESAAAFVRDHAAVFGVATADLRPQSILADGRPTQPLMYDRKTGTYKFTLVYYSQFKDGVPVFRSDLRLLVRNEDGAPLVLAKGNLRDLGDFRLDGAGAAVQITPEQAYASASAAFPLLDRFGETTPVVWAGVDGAAARPALAVRFEASAGTINDPGYQKWLFLVDAQTGELLHRENLILHGDAEGTISAMATQGDRPAEFAPEVLTAMAYAQAVVSGGDTVFADAAGNFTVGIQRRLGAHRVRRAGRLVPRGEPGRGGQPAVADGDTAGPGRLRAQHVGHGLHDRRGQRLRARERGAGFRSVLQPRFPRHRVAARVHRQRQHRAVVQCLL
jgi:hypothetical protein